MLLLCSVDSVLCLFVIVSTLSECTDIERTHLNCHDSQGQMVWSAMVLLDLFFRSNCRWSWKKSEYPALTQNCIAPLDFMNFWWTQLLVKCLLVFSNNGGQICPAAVFRYYAWKLDCITALINTMCTVWLTKPISRLKPAHSVVLWMHGSVRRLNPN